MIEFRDIDQTFLGASRKWFEDEAFRRMVDAPLVDEAAQRDWFDTLPGRDDYRIWGVIGDGNWIGSTGLKHIDRRQGVAEYWGMIYPVEFRGQGNGHRMFARCVAHAHELGLSRIRLRVLNDNEQAIAAYHRWGLHPTFEDEDGFIHMEIGL